MKNTNRNTLVYLETGSTDAAYNLAFEEYILKNGQTGQDYFLLWQNLNTVVVGRFQNTAAEINGQFIHDKNIQVVRRLSGGGAVYHDLGNLNFTFIVDSSRVTAYDFSIFVEPLLQTLRSLGVQAEFTGRNDVVIGGRKCSGSSQYTKKGKILHHGTILISTDVDTMEKALCVDQSKLLTKGASSVRSRVTNISEEIPGGISVDQFKEKLLDTVRESTELHSESLSSDDLKKISVLAEEKYRNWDWNFGRSPGYTWQKQKRFPFGTVCASYETTGERLKELKLTGDFFGSEQLQELENHVIGCRLNEDLLHRLEDIHTEKYINSMTARELYELIVF